MLDEQLSHDIGRTLDRANIQRPSSNYVLYPTGTPPKPGLPPAPFYGPTAPYELPAWNFANEFPPLPSRNWHPTPLHPHLPSWCPELPSFTRQRLTWNDLPLFFDLSALPDKGVPSKPPPSRCQDVQLWQPRSYPEPKKQSRFFPPPAPVKPKMKSPSHACKLHSLDRGVEHDTPTCPPKLTNATNLESELAASNSTPANLWHILTTCPPPASRYNTLYHPWNPIYAAPYGTFDHRLEAIGRPIELANTDLPFVQSNSLTGLANSQADFPLPHVDDLALIFDTSPPVNEPTRLNEPMVDPYYPSNHEADLASLPPLPPSPEPEVALPVLAVNIPATSFYPGGHVYPGGHEVSDSGPQQIDAHFRSEEALFKPPAALPSVAPAPVPSPISEDGEILDVALCLQMVGRDAEENCRAQSSNEAETSLSTSVVLVDDGWDIFDEEADESWDWREDTFCEAWEAEWGVFVTGEDSGYESEGVDGCEEEDAVWVQRWRWECGIEREPSWMAHVAW
ncbi:hypothetical protein BDY17DRAFT_307082 [Neohortaea acidophila]|uniref:Uncharacterized protein n=1 Tax=Neohortaea acidophila TaxID=245834 RepID=A0A6A6Q7V6_9PEZI|nr:uncharacterized protein BDY17DRAFT_307082 [Neohortaea acidophila]KAF2487733.1 hypothetical protein BDY17DRAFT_307082 [Neohortaea acidophila]